MQITWQLLLQCYSGHSLLPHSNLAECVRKNKKHEHKKADIKQQMGT